MFVAAREWCEQQFGRAELADARRTRRLVAVATAMTETPQQSIPQQMKSPAATKAAYRLMSNPSLTHESTQQAHRRNTRQMALEHPTVLLIQDTTYVDLTGRQVADVGVIGDGNGQGFVLHSTLAVLPDDPGVLGLMHQIVHRRQPTNTANEPSYKRTKRETEARFWSESVEAIGMAPTAARWVYVADRGADVYAFYGACRAQQADILVRIAQDRRMLAADNHQTHVVSYLRQLPAIHHMQVEVTDKTKTPRQAQVSVAYAPVTLLPPRHARADAPGPQTVYGIRVWEPAPPTDAEPLEWLLATSLPINTVNDVVTFIGWDTQRPTIEDYHQCAKTGCQIENRQLHSADNFERLIGILGVVAIYLLQLRAASRQSLQSTLPPDLDADTVAVIAAMMHTVPEQLTAAATWLWIAQQGGYLNRKHDPPPGWKSIWHGWHFLQNMVHGYRLAKNLTSQ